MSVFPQPQHAEHPATSGGFPVFTAGWYRAQIDEIKNEPMKSGNGEAVKIVLTAMSDGYSGRKIFVKINARHTNATTEGIGQRQIDSLLDATGFTRATLQSYGQMQRKFVLVKLKVKPAQGDFDAQNDLVTFDKPDADRQLVPPPSRLGSAPPSWQNGGAPGQAAGAAPRWQGGSQARAQQAPSQQQAQDSAPADTAVVGSGQQQPANPPPSAGEASGKAPPPWKR